MLFKTRYNPGVRKACPSGDGLVIVHRKSFDVHGNPILVEDRTKNLYEEIQSYEMETDIKTILCRYANGDISAINKKPGFYGDISGIPTNVNDVMTFGENVGKWFNALPSFLKEKYKTSEDLLAAVNNGDFLKFINENKKEREVKENEQKHDA